VRKATINAANSLDTLTENKDEAPRFAAIFQKFGKMVKKKCTGN